MCMGSSSQYFQVANNLFAYLETMSSSIAPAPLTEWERRWSPAHQWKTLVLTRKFREEATDFVYQKHSNPSFYLGDPVFVYCPNCAKGKRYECLFFHPSVAQLFLDVIHGLDRKLREPQLNNNEVVLRILQQLPSLFDTLGHPFDFGEYGGSWSCIKDKLFQTFPYDALLMLNIPYFIERHKQLFHCDDSDEDTDIDELESLYFAHPSDPNNTLYWAKEDIQYRSILHLRQ